MLYDLAYNDLNPIFKQIIMEFIQYNVFSPHPFENIRLNFIEIECYISFCYELIPNHFGNLLQKSAKT